MKPLMIQGTGSHVGKSFIVAALCRVFLRRGIEVAPFKAQNMSNNAAAVTGGEIGRAQALQAAAARLDPDVRMNPLLLKPTANHKSQAVLLGKPLGTFSVSQIDRRKPVWFRAVRKAFDGLKRENDLVLIEGAGSPAEINLRQVDYANMRVADMAGAAVILVGDIDRGGVFASLHGTLDLIRPAGRRRVIGFCINKFRGDASLLKSGIRFLESRWNRPALGVIPYDTELRLPEEDSLALAWSTRPTPGRMRSPAGSAAPRPQVPASPTPAGSAPLAPQMPGLVLGLVLTPHIANFTDFDPFREESDVTIRDVRSPRDLQGTHAILLPGSKNVFADWAFLRRSGLAAAITTDNTRPIFGICGGYQILGRTIQDPVGVESGRPAEIEALGILPVRTRFFRKKIVRPVVRRHRASRSEIRGYEIHQGLIFPDPPPVRPLFVAAGGEPEGCVSPDGRVMGTVTHGVFDSDRFRNFYLNQLRKRAGLPSRPPTQFELEPRIERAADLVESHLDIDFVCNCLNSRS